MIIDIGHVELCVKDASQASLLYHGALNFSLLKKTVLSEDGWFSSRYLMRHNNINLLLTSSSSQCHQYHRHVAKHGDSISNLTLIVTDIDAIAARARECGIDVAYSTDSYDIYGSRKQLQLKMFGSVTHTIIADNTGLSHENSSDLFSDKGLAAEQLAPENLFQRLDHVAICIEAGEFDYWLQVYTSVFSMAIIHTEEVLTESSGMKSCVLASSNGAVKLVLTAPLSGSKKSQIQEFIDNNGGAGIQHLAFETADIVSAIDTINSNNIQLLRVPGSYYTQLEQDGLDMIDIKKLLQPRNILLDTDVDGQLYQAFTLPLYDKPTFFLELIQRDGSQGFGSRNIRALFKAVELEQARRSLDVE